MSLDRDLVAAALPGYSIAGEIGRGGWGVVLRARHTALGREVAIKQLPRAFAADADSRDRFIAEARMIAQLDHPHIVKVYDFVEHQGTWLIVLELLPGGTLWDRFSAHGMRADQACGIGLAICSALHAAHREGILHRDVKPENVLFAPDGSVRLGDFGIAKDVDVDTRRTRIGEVVGTPTYMSPEQALGEEVTAASDVYSLGVVLYELLAGRTPFPEVDSPTQQLVQHATVAPAPLAEVAPQVAAPVAAVVMQALAKAPAARFATAEAFGVALAAAAGEAYGPRWLAQSGTVLRGGGAIEAAALRGTTQGGRRSMPTQAQPVLRRDHFRPAEAGVEAGAGAGVEAGATGAWAAPPAGPGGAAAAAAPGPPPTHAAGPGSAPPPPPPATPPASRADASGPYVPSAPPRRGARRRVVALVATAVVVIGVVAAAVFALGGGDDDDVAGASTTASASSTSAAATTGAAATTAPATTAAPQTTSLAASCPASARCAFITGITAEGDHYVIDWIAVGFKPSYEKGFFHAHFYWDTFTAAEAGTNAAAFGVQPGLWELTDLQPYATKNELLIANRPEPANRICVTVANFAHAVDNPNLSHCVPIPSS